MDDAKATVPNDSNWRWMTEHPLGLTKSERLYREMFERFARASEGPVVNPGRKRRGRLVFGDDTDDRR